jgi:alpha,alpha-trehalase
MLTDDELDRWGDVARKLYVPFHDDGIISQFEGYGELDEFDWEGYRNKYGNIQRLDRILEAEGESPNRYKVSKQADVLMLFYLFSSEELTQLFEQLGYDFDPKSIPRQIDYYLQRTAHGSTLSWVAHAWVLARANRRKSWRLFESALDSDIADIQGGTTPEGIHLGAMAGTVDLLQRCYLGVEPRGGILHVNPALPEDLWRLVTTIRYRGHTLDVDVESDTMRIASRQETADPITIGYRGRFRQLSPGSLACFRLVSRAKRHDEDEQRCEAHVQTAPARQAAE